jgi:hypothetical protein
MIVLHYRAIPDLRRHVQQAIGASARAARQQASARRPRTAAATPAGAGMAAQPTRPRSVRRRAGACTHSPPPGRTAR